MLQDMNRNSQPESSECLDVRNTYISGNVPILPYFSLIQLKSILRSSDIQTFLCKRLDLLLTAPTRSREG